MDDRAPILGKISMINNPFSFGNPITTPDRFIGRLREIEQIQSRLHNNEFESTAIVGERRTGKTSLLMYLAHPQVAQEAGFSEDRYVFVPIDLQFVVEDNTPTDFWRIALNALKCRIQDEELIARIDKLCLYDNIDTALLADLFSSEIDPKNMRIVLLLDEFENVTKNQNFNLSFYTGLRALAINYNLALITSSRRSLIDLTISKEVRSSPFFNIFADVNLYPFSISEVDTFFRRYLAENGIRFHKRDLQYILKLAGPHPHFLQMASSLLYATYLRRNNDQTALGLLQSWQKKFRFLWSNSQPNDLLAEEFRDKADPLFRGYWHNLSPQQRAMLTLMSLRYLERRDNSGDTLEQLKRYDRRAERNLQDLKKRSLILVYVRNVPKYRPLSMALAEWVKSEFEQYPEDKTQNIYNWLSDRSRQSEVMKSLEALLMDDARGEGNQEVSERTRHLRNLLKERTKLLARLREQEARYAPSHTPINIQTDIEDIENEIEEIYLELSELEQTKDVI
jgi:hypothetical protein